MHVFRIPRHYSLLFYFTHTARTNDSGQIFGTCTADQVESVAQAYPTRVYPDKLIKYRVTVTNTKRNESLLGLGLIMCVATGCLDMHM